MIDLAIVGAGPNCTYAVERLAVMLGRRRRPVDLRIRIFEKSGFFGAGNIHRPDQPKSSLLNRIIGQVAFAPDESYPAAEGLLPRELRPTMHEWSQHRYRETGDAQYNLAPQDWPPRRLLGEALTDHFNKYLALLRSVAGVEVELLTLEVTGISRADGHYLLSVDDPGRAPFRADHVLFVTGNSINRPRTGSLEEQLERAAARSSFDYIGYPYPLDRISEELTSPERVVGCIGLGQTANDVILYLTEERGGQFVNAAGEHGLRYVPSGREPRRIVAISQSGVFTAARPVNQKLADPARLEHAGLFFTNQAIDSLRTSYGSPSTIAAFGRQQQLDFERHVFPLMLLEMECLDHKTLFGPDFGREIAAASRTRFTDFIQGAVEVSSRDEAIAFLLEPLRDQVARKAGDAPGAELFSWHDLIDPIPRRSYDSAETYTRALLAYMKRDHAQCTQGNVANPTKAATDGVWRDLRETLSYAIDFGGLTSDSHRTFLREYLRYHNRLADGAAVELMEKMRALVVSGLLDVGTGPSPEVVVDEEDRVRFKGPHTGSARLVDVVIDCRLSGIDLRRDASPLYQSLVNNGLVQLWVNPGRDGDAGFAPGGPVLNRDCHPIGTDGRANDRLTFIGPPTEGMMFFQVRWRGPTPTIRS